MGGKSPTCRKTVGAFSGSPTRLSPARQGIYFLSRLPLNFGSKTPKGFGEPPGKSETCRASVGQTAFHIRWCTTGACLTLWRYPEPDLCRREIPRLLFYNFV